MNDETPPELSALINREAASAGPTPDARRELRAKLGATLGIAAASAVVGTATAHAAATSAAAGAATTTVAGGVTAGIVTKITVLALVVGGISGGGYMLARSRGAPAPTVSAPARVAVASPVAVAAPPPRVTADPIAPRDERVEETPPASPPASAPARVVGVEPPAERVVPTKPSAERTAKVDPVVLRTEEPPSVAASPPADASVPVEAPPREPESQSAMLSRAWTLIDNGKAEEALALADADAAAHRDGALSEERDAVRVRALLSLDRRAEARAAARAFQAKYPSSIHSALIESALNK